MVHVKSEPACDGNHQCRDAEDCSVPECRHLSCRRLLCSLQEPYYVVRRKVNMNNV
jgi:hypothetical protein